MSDRLRSVGLDIGTTSTQMVVSELTLENRASSFSVPEICIRDRKILYQSPVYFTPLLDERRMDAAALRRLVEEEYQKAGITRETVDTGAVIITGETSRKENAAAVLEALSGLAGDFVSAAAGPDLESLLAARGAGAPEYSERTGKTVLHMDIGGGTSNLCLIRQGQVLRTGCLNVGGRLIKLKADGTVTSVSPVLRELVSLRPGDRMTKQQAEEIAGRLTAALEMAAGLRPPEPLLTLLGTEEAEHPWFPPEETVVLSFSGGVADCMEPEENWLRYGDLGVVLGKAIRESALCQGEFLRNREAIRATVIGAGCHSTQLSGSTVFCRNVAFPLKNLPVVTGKLPEGERGILALPPQKTPDYGRICDLAGELAAQNGPLMLCMEQDMAKALGVALALRTAETVPILCIDRVKVSPGSFLDIGAPVVDAFPVVVKTLVLGTKKEESL